MSAIFLSTESQSPAAQMIIDCFIEIQQNMDIVSLDKYTDAILRTPLSKITSTGEIEQRFRLN